MEFIAVGIRHWNAEVWRWPLRQDVNNSRAKVFHPPARPYGKCLYRNNIEGYKFPAFGFVLPAGDVVDYLIKYLGTFSEISFSLKSKLDISQRQFQSTVFDPHVWDAGNVILIPSGPDDNFTFIQRALIIHYSSSQLPIKFSASRNHYHRIHSTLSPVFSCMYASVTLSKRA